MSSKKNANKSETVAKENDFSTLEEAFSNFNGDFMQMQQLDYYFDSYSHSGIHYEMLNDKVRTLAYQDSIMKHKHLFKGKVVLDIGCGTGILSMFAAAAGAKKVIGIEMAHISKAAEENIRNNGFADRIQVIKGKIEELELPVDQVDIIVSEWMGYFLLYEGMFDSVLFARDKWLKKGGFLFPDKANIYLSCFYDKNYESSSRNRWDGYFGLNLAEVDEISRLGCSVQRFPSSKIITDQATLIQIDLETCTKDDLDFKSPFNFDVSRKGFINGAVLWFDTVFSHGTEPVILSTSPYDPTTHWKQGCMYFKDSLPVNKGDKIGGYFIMRKNAVNYRNLDMKIVLNTNSNAGSFSIVEYYLFG